MIQFALRYASWSQIDEVGLERLRRKVDGMKEGEMARRPEQLDFLEPAANELSRPTPATPADIRRVKALMRSVAIELRQHDNPALNAADRNWMETHPQSLWPLLDAAVAASATRKRDDALITACQWLLANQLELIRYRLERGHDWARVMLEVYQEKLIGLARSNTLPAPDWFVLVNLLKDAKVPIRPEMMEALSRAIAEVTPGEAPELDDIGRELQGLVDQMGASVGDDPFMVVEGLAETGTLMPADLRAYLTHELGLSRHSVLREALPLLLLDPEPMVRQAAAAALEQVATPETFSPVMLRRTLLVRNWVPEIEREAIDRLVRKARVKGVACAQWPPAATLAIQCSAVDGSGAQSLILTTPGGRNGLFAGILLKQGFGVRDAWCDLSVPRSKITRSLKEVRHEMQWISIGRDYLDLVVQHHIASGLAAGNLPLTAIVQIAEAIGATDWKDRGLNVAVETERLFAGLGIEANTKAAIDASLQRSSVLLVEDPIMQSWFEDDAAIRELVNGRPRLKHDVAVRRVLNEVLPARREIWAERLLFLALWMQAGTAAAAPVEWARDCVVLAHELLTTCPLAELPAMVTIAERSVFVARVG